MTTERKFKAGDRVRCVYPEGWGDRLTQGRVYTVRSVDDDGDPRVERDDQGRGPVTFLAWRFELVEQETTPTACDPTNPPHYSRFKIQPLDFIRENNLSFLAGNVIKYVMRHDAKNGKEDLEKARRYLDEMIKGCA